MDTNKSFKDSNPKTAAATYKVSTSVVSQLVLMEVAAAMAEGASKYGRHNYREEGVRISTYFDGTRRHLDLFWEGQDIDPDSGLNHITKAITSLVVLRDAMILGLAVDDRPPSLSEEELVRFIANLEAVNKRNIEVYKDRDVKHVTKNNVNLARVNECKAAAAATKGNK